MSTEFTLPETMKALVLRFPADGPSVETVSTPMPAPGAAVVRVLSATVLHFVRDMYLGKRPVSLPLPLTIGTSAIGRVIELGSDATKLKPSDLVFVDIVLRSRDNNNDVCLAGVNEGFSPGSKKLMAGAYRDWTYAEYCLVPLENLVLLDEGRLLGGPTKGGLGYKIEDLNFITTLLVPFSGLRDIDLRPGQTIIIAPANGSFGGAGVLAALAMRARVIAMGRDKSKLSDLKQNVPNPDPLEIVPITDDVDADADELKKIGRIDAYLDIGPMQAYNSTHIKSCLRALKHGGKVSLMGGYREDVALPHSLIMQKNLKLFGRYMYEREIVTELVDMVESGVLKLGEQGGSAIIGCYPLEDWRNAWDAAVASAGVGKTAVIKP